MLELFQSKSINFLDIVDSLPANIFWKIRDKQGNFIYRGANKNVLQVVGCGGLKELIGKTDFDFFTPELAQYLKMIDEQVYKTGGEIVLEEKGVSADGIEAIYLTQKKPLRNKRGGIIGIMGVSQDITPLKRQEKELKEAIESKDRFLANFSHDTRTPLQVILSSTELLEAKDCNPACKPHIETIRDQATELDKQISRIVEYSGSLASSVKFSWVNLKEVIEFYVKINQFTAIARGLNLELEYNGPEVIYSNAYAIEDILKNLLGNALKFTHEGSIKVSVTDNVIEIADTGIGIPADKHALIFERGERGERSDQSQYEGSGLGLSIVRDAAERIGARVSVESELGKGSIFRVTFGGVENDGEQTNNISS
jgi:two-component system aerobic respiration control sensor histidine kinase ArcB